MSQTKKDEKREPTEHGRKAREHTVIGGAVGALGAGSLVVLGVTCPLCVVAAPAFICSGLYNAHKDRKSRRNAESALEDGPDGSIELKNCRPLEH